MTDFPIIDAHIHICRCVNGFGAEGELQAVGKGYVEYASGNRFPMIPPELGEYDVTPEAVLRILDQEGVSKAVMMQGNFLGQQNLYTYDAMKKYPHRLIGAASYDPFCRKYKEVRNHFFEELGFHIVKFEVSTGSGLMSYHHDFNLAGDMMEEALSYAEAHHHTVVFDIGRQNNPCWQPENLAKAAKRHPSLQFVVCHLLAPQGLAQKDAWFEALNMLNLENVVFDISSLPASQKPETYPYPTAIYFMKKAINLFGADRLMWGSDLPSNLCKDSYRHLIDHILLSNEFTDRDKENIFYQVAEKIYFN